MGSEKTGLPSLRNIEWRTIKTETNKINQVLPYISTNYIAELNELIYSGAKLVGEEIGIPSKSKKKNQNQDGKFVWKRRKNLRKQAKIRIKKLWKDAETCRDKKEKAIQIEK